MQGDHTTNFSAGPVQRRIRVTASHDVRRVNCSALDFSPSFTCGDRRARADEQRRPDDRQHLDPRGQRRGGAGQGLSSRSRTTSTPTRALFFGSHCSQASFAGGNVSVQHGRWIQPPPPRRCSASRWSATSNWWTVRDVPQPRPRPEGPAPPAPPRNHQRQAPGNTVTFDGLPDIPISRVAAHLHEPTGGLLGTSRDICAPQAPNFHADFTGYNGKTASAEPRPQPWTAVGPAPAPAPTPRSARRRGRRSTRSTGPPSPKEAEEALLEARRSARSAVSSTDAARAASPTRRAGRRRPWRSLLRSRR